MSTDSYSFMVLVQPLKFRQKFVSKMIVTANLKFNILSMQCCGNHFGDAYDKLQLFVLAATWTSLGIYLGKNLKLKT